MLATTSEKIYIFEVSSPIVAVFQIRDRLEGGRAILFVEAYRCLRASDQKSSTYQISFFAGLFALGDGCAI